MITHTVVLQFKPDVSAVLQDRLIRKIGNLSDEIRSIRSFIDYCVDDSTRVFSMKFNLPQERDDYLVHPAHEAVKAQVDPYVDGAKGVLAFDYVPTSVEIETTQTWRIWYNTIFRRKYKHIAFYHASLNADALREFQVVNPTIFSCEYGEYSSQEGLNQGLTFIIMIECYLPASQVRFPGNPKIFTLGLRATSDMDLSL